MEHYFTFNKFLKDKFGKKVRKIPVDVGLGCPNRENGKTGCIFCNPASYVPAWTLEKISIEGQIQAGLEITKKKDSLALVYLQAGTNTYADPLLLERIYKSVFIDESIVGLIIGTRPDCLSDEVIDLISDLNKNHYCAMEIGIQACDDNILNLLKRGHVHQDSINAVKKLAKKNIDVFAHVILGLPGHDEKTVIKEAQEISKLDLRGVKIHNFHVCKDTELEGVYKGTREQGNEGTRGVDFGAPEASHPGLVSGSFEHVLNLLSENEYIDLLVSYLAHLNPNFSILRLFADTKPDLMLAPKWKKLKSELILMLNQKMDRESLFQGKYFKNSN
ncbi:MAG: TIGR01212 family radical SAM protein [Pseudomonadota bacterium]